LAVPAQMVNRVRPIGFLGSSAEEDMEAAKRKNLQINVRFVAEPLAVLDAKNPMPVEGQRAHRNACPA
jgi:hypothetical protein